MIPNTDLTFDIGSSTKRWNKTYTGHVTAAQSATSGVPAISVTSADVDKIAIDVDAEQTSANVVDIDANSLTTGRVLDITAPALTTGSALNINSDSNSTGTRNIASIVQENAAASGSTSLYLRNDHATADALKVIGAVTVGVDDTGHDVKFFGATSGAYMLWDESTDDLKLAGAAGLDVDGATNLDVVQIDGTVTVGVNDTGYDVKLFGATSGKSWLWDESDNKMIIAGDAAVTGTTTLTGVTQQTGALTVGIDGTGHDVIFYGDTAGSNMTWDQSDDALELTDSTPIRIGDDAAGDMTLYHDGTNSFITNKTGELKVATETSGIIVRIGHTTSEVYTGQNLTVNGTLTELSQREMKTNIEPIENILPAVLQLQGISFDWKKDKNEKNHYGFIAEDVEKILPNLVSHDEEGKAQGIQYSKMTAVLLEAIKEQQIQIDELKSKLN